MLNKLSMAFLLLFSVAEMYLASKQIEVYVLVSQLFLQAGDLPLHATELVSCPTAVNNFTIGTYQAIDAFQDGVTRRLEADLSRRCFHTQRTHGTVNKANKLKCTKI